jgi:hypothetical protein
VRHEELGIITNGSNCIMDDATRSLDDRALDFLEFDPDFRKFDLRIAVNSSQIIAPSSLRRPALPLLYSRASVDRISWSYISIGYKCGAGQFALG